MQCKNCGMNVSNGASFCEYCGTSLNVGGNQSNAYNDPFSNQNNAYNDPFSNQNNNNNNYNNGYNNNNQNNVAQNNTMAIAGLILAFFIPLFGIVFSILGLQKSKQMNGKGKGIAIAGIIVSIANMAVSFIISMFILPSILEQLDEMSLFFTTII